MSSGGAVSYVETADLIGNPEAVEDIIRYIHYNILYAEINRKSGGKHGLFFHPALLFLPFVQKSVSFYKP